jgi:hypothetical protein
VTLRARWVTLRARWVTLRARWVTLRAHWVTLRARWVTLRARWVMLTAFLLVRFRGWTGATVRITSRACCWTRTFAPTGETGALPPPPVYLTDALRCNLEWKLERNQSC